MHVRHLSLTNFRNYRRLELDLPSGRLLFLGENAQGKTNLLEAVYLLSTMRSLRAGTDAELINWEAAQADPGVARLEAEADRNSGPVKVEMAVQARSNAGRGRDGEGRALKRLRVNGAVKRASEALGQINSVFFTSQDMELISGSPSLRRRYLDITLTQADRRYLRALQQYNRTLVQRNALLKRIQAGVAHREELAFWDTQAAQSGAYVVAARARTIERLDALAREAQSFLSGQRERLELVYRPQWATGWESARIASADEGESTEAYLRTLAEGREREIGAGVTLSGPHRDDLLFLLDGRSAAAYASRAQARTAALSLRLAEARFLLAGSGDHPVLLLDDVLSEMDEGRRAGVLEAIAGFDQVWVTSAEKGEGAALLPEARVYAVRAGEVTPV